MLMIRLDFTPSANNDHLIQGCQGYGPRAGPGPTVRHIRPAGDKGRIYFFILFFSNFSNFIFFKFSVESVSWSVAAARLSCSR